MKIKGSRFSLGQSKKLLEFFVADVTARMAAKLAGVNRNSANLFYNNLRKIIVCPFYRDRVALFQRRSRG
jgi:transposase